MIYIIIIGTSIAVLTCALFLTKRPLLKNDKLISLYMLFLVIPMLEKLLVLKVVHFPYFQFSIFYGSVLTFGPFLYRYAYNVIYPDSPFTFKQMLHFLPFIFSLLFFFILGMNMPIKDLSPKEIDILFFKKDPIVNNFLYIFDILCVLSLIIYTFLILSLLAVHRKKLPDYFSYDSIAINLKWLNWITISFFISYGIAILPPPFLDNFSNISQFDLGITRDIGTSFFIFAFSFCTIKQPVIFKLDSVPSEQSVSEFPTENKEKRYSKSGLKEEDAQKYLLLLEEFMQKEKPFLNPDLTIMDISIALNIQKHYITQIINEKLNKNFYQYINEYRINEAKEKIGDLMYRDHSMLRIAFDCGFNSKSVFNAIFKKTTGFTPTEYKKRVLP